MFSNYNPGVKHDDPQYFVQDYTDLGSPKELEQIFIKSMKNVTNLSQSQLEEVAKSPARIYEYLSKSKTGLNNYKNNLSS